MIRCVKGNRLAHCLAYSIKLAKILALQETEGVKMNNFLYFLVNNERTEFKIGVTDNIEERYLRLASIWGDMNLMESRMLIGSRREVIGLEKSLHFLLQEWRIEKPRKVDGYTEWFSMDCFDKAMEIIEFAAKIYNLNLNDKLIIGIRLINQEDRRSKRNKRPKKIVEVVADFEGISTRWPLYKKGTIVFKDHPKILDTWLWIIDIGELSVHEFREIFRFQNSDSAFYLISEAFYHKENPSVVNAHVSKNCFKWLGMFPDYKPCYEFISREFNLLICQG